MGEYVSLREAGRRLGVSGQALSRRWRRYRELGEGDFPMPRVTSGKTYLWDFADLKEWWERPTERE